MNKGTKICSTTVPRSMVFQGCTAFTQEKKYSAHNILLCDSKHHTHVKRVKRDVYEILQKSNFRQYLSKNFFLVCSIKWLVIEIKNFKNSFSKGKG